MAFDTRRRTFRENRQKLSIGHEYNENYVKITWVGKQEKNLNSQMAFEKKKIMQLAFFQNQTM